MKKFVRLLVVVLAVLSVSTVEARGWRRGRIRQSYSVSYSATYSFEGNAQSVCEQKASLQARLGRMFHPGGSFGGGSCEGVACAGDPDSALNSCCYSNSGRTIIGQAVFQGANGMFYACRIFR